MTTLMSKAATAGRRLAIIGIFSVGVLGLAACTAAEPTPTPTASPEASASPTPTPTPTPSAVPTGETPPPTSVEEALAGSAAAVDEYLRIWGEIEADHPDDSSAIDIVALEDAATLVHNSAARRLAEGIVATGQISFEVGSASNVAEASQGETVIPFGTANLMGCFDTSQATATYLDGSAVPMNSVRRAVITITLVYAPTEQRWLVRNLVDTAEVVPC